ncbi:MAG: hypothetical protein AAF614_38165 [Chloroflexota bacterium]
MFNINSAIDDFRQARRQARLEAFLSGWGGKSADLLPYEEVRRLLRAYQQTERGLQEIPLDAIVGSVGRYRDFTRTFLPKTDSDQERWAQVKVAQFEKGLPPIEVYKIGDVYFVRDGNHRVSIARQDGSSTIEAYVTEVFANVLLTPDSELDELILQAEYADFLQQTQLDKLRPETAFNLTLPGKYPLLREHIAVHRYYMGVEQKRDIAVEEAVVHWHDTVFAPTVDMIREQGLLAGFPERTSADLYVWLAEHRAELEEVLGWPIATPTAVSALAHAISPVQPTGLLGRALQNVTGQRPQRRNEWWIQQYLKTADSQLFATVLLPLNPTDSGWHTIEQGVRWAQREQSQLIGLHAVAEPNQQTGLVAQIVDSQFREKVSAAQLNVLFKAEVGELKVLVPRLARWADLVVLSMPAESDSDGWEMVQRTRGLMLLVPPEATLATVERVLLAYDASPYALEALLVAAYLQRDWQVAVTVAVAEENIAEATAVLGAHDLAADILLQPEQTAVALREAVTEANCQLVVAGGYTSATAHRSRRLFLDSLVIELGRQTETLLLLCR